MSYFVEKLTSLSPSSLKATTTPNDLLSALEKIETLKTLNNQLTQDLKCEHDEKSDLISIKVGLESEILELREVNERLNFQVEQLKDEKDKIHHVLARIREDTHDGLFIATSSGVSGQGTVKVMIGLINCECV